MADDKKDEEALASVVSEGMMTSTPDNYEDQEEAKPLPPITQSERDLANSRPLISPADESRVTAKAETKPENSEQVQALLNEEKSREEEKAAKDEEAPLTPKEEAPKEEAPKATASKTSTK